MYRRKYKPRFKKQRYSNETTAINIQSTVEDTSTFPTYPLVSPPRNIGYILVNFTDVQGTRKVKNMLLSIQTTGNSQPIMGTVVYVPQGTPMSALTVASLAGNTGSSLYEPNQNVIMQFVLEPGTGNYITTEGTSKELTLQSQIQRFKTRLARNLDSGDCIMIGFAYTNAPTSSETVKIVGTFNYAISY